MRNSAANRMPAKRGKQISLLVLLLALVSACSRDNAPDTVSISIVGTGDVHGALVPKNGHGGLGIFGGYIRNLRAAQEEHGGALLLLDGGDMWQGTLESNVTEGASVVDVYNTLGYTAAAIGNHDFDFGPVGPDPVPTYEDDDPRGALKARAAEATFPLLTANIIDGETGIPVNWPNVSPTMTIDVDGVTIGIIGATTERTLATTIAENTGGLEIAPLAETFRHHASVLRDDGADIVLVTVHAGGRCDEFDDPDDLSSCNPESEIFRVARSLPAGLVDVILAAHTHEGIAHTVNGIAIVSAYSSGLAFSRVDLVYDKKARKIAQTRIFAPQYVCEFRDPGTDDCTEHQEGSVASEYEGRPVTRDLSVAGVIASAADAVIEYKQREVGVTVESDMLRSRDPDSAIGNLLTTALLEMSGGADVAIHNTVGGIRADLLAGPLTYGDIFEVFPFDNKVVSIELSGKDLKTVFAQQIAGEYRRAGIAGMQVIAACTSGELGLTLLRPDGSEIADDEMLVVATNDFLVSGGDRIFTPVTPADGLPSAGSYELFREQIARWLRERGGVLHPEEFYSREKPRFVLPAKPPISCNSTA